MYPGTLNPSQKSYFLIFIYDYTKGNTNRDRNHWVSAIFKENIAWLFNSHGHVSKSMDFFVEFLKWKGFDVQHKIQYNGPNLQALNTTGVCSQFAKLFLERCSPKRSVTNTQQKFDDYVVQRLSIPASNLEKQCTLKNTSIRAVGLVTRKNNNNLSERRRKYNIPVPMNTNNRRRVVRRAIRPVTQKKRKTPALIKSFTDILRGGIRKK